MFITLTDEKDGVMHVRPEAIISIQPTQLSHNQGKRAGSIVHLAGGGLLKVQEAATAILVACENAGLEPITPLRVEPITNPRLIAKAALP